MPYTCIKCCKNGASVADLVQAKSRQSTPSSQCSSGTSWKIFSDAGSTRIKTWTNASEIGERRSQRSRKCFDESSAALHAFDVMLHCARRMQCQLPRVCPSRAVEKVAMQSPVNCDYLITLRLNKVSESEFPEPADKIVGGRMDVSVLCDGVSMTALLGTGAMWLNEEKDLVCLIHENCKGNDDLILGTNALASSKKWGEEMLRLLGQMQQHLVGSASCAGRVLIPPYSRRVVKAISTNKHIVWGYLTFCRPFTQEGLVKLDRDAYCVEIRNDSDEPNEEGKFDAKQRARDLNSDERVNKIWKLLGIEELQIQ
ncbi:unnamed protein product, partial [Gongylonema pulchrum]|uniref:DUF1758 domain-containing protein n=1 Tax=Gongylonema pulchrum TaxID=637853 RepID=A0A183EDV6_9BILA